MEGRRRVAPFSPPPDPPTPSLRSSLPGSEGNPPLRSLPMFGFCRRGTEEEYSPGVASPCSVIRVPKYPQFEKVNPSAKTPHPPPPKIFSNRASRLWTIALDRWWGCVTLGNRREESSNKTAQRQHAPQTRPASKVRRYLHYTPRPTPRPPRGLKQAPKGPGRTSKVEGGSRHDGGRAQEWRNSDQLGFGFESHQVVSLDSTLLVSLCIS